MRISLLPTPADKYQQLIQLSDDDRSRLSLLGRPPSLIFIHKCAELCEDFNENLDFHFTFFGLTKLLVRMCSYLITG